MTDLPIALAIAAGSVAALNPCGFALLPAYLSLFITEGAPSRRLAVIRAVAATLAMATGFAAVFVAVGLILAPVAGTVQRSAPWFTVLLGLLLAATGAWLLAGRRLPALRLLSPSRRPIRRAWGSMVGFGAAYAVASLGCTIGPFLAIVVATFRTDSAIAGLALFIAYTAGMAMVVGAAALAVALARTSLVGRMRRAGRWVSRLGAAVLLIAGAYVAYYGWYEIRVFRGGNPSDPVIEAAAQIQAWLAAAVTTVLWPLAIAVAVLLAVAVVRSVLRRSRHRSGRGRGAAASSEGNV